MVAAICGERFIERVFVKLITSSIHFLHGWGVAECNIVWRNADNGPITPEKSLDGMALSEAELLGSKPQGRSGGIPRSGDTAKWR